MNHAILDWLAGQGHDLTVLLTRPRLPWPVQLFGAYLTARVEGPGLVSWPGGVAAPLAAPRILARRVLARRLRPNAYGGADAVLGRFIDPPAAAWCAARIAALRPGAVLVDTIFRAPLLRLVQPPGVLIAHDVFHRRHAGLVARGYRVHPGSLTAAEEAALLNLADTVVAIQADDAAELAALLPATRVIAAPMPVRPRPRPAGVARAPRSLVFLGSDSLPNVDGLRWFLAEVWPLLRDVQLELCGSVCGAIGAVPPGVRKLGRVPDIAPVLHRASLGVAPLLAGSGLKIKLLDFCAHGLAAATTPVGAAGFAPGGPFLIAEGPKALAAAITTALAQPAEHRDAAALAYAGRFAPDRVFADLGACLPVQPCGPIAQPAPIVPV